MRLVSLGVNKEVQSLAAGDFNGDGKTDLAFYGTPAELVILPGEGKGKFGDPKKINTGEAVESGGALTVGDLNGDGRDDLALLTAGEVITILQGEGGKLGEPERIPHTATNPRMVKAVDLDGDGALDLALLDGSPDDPIRVRFSGKGGTHGPEQRCSPGLEVFAGLRVRPGRRQARGRVADDRGGLGPGPRPRPRRGRRRRDREAWPASLLPAPPRQHPRAVARPRRPRRRRPGRRRRRRPGQRPVLRLQAGQGDRPGREPGLPLPGGRPGGPSRRPRRRQEGRGLCPLGAGEADRPEHLRRRPALVPCPAADQRRARRAGGRRPRRRQEGRDRLRHPRQGRRLDRRPVHTPGTEAGEVRRLRPLSLGPDRRRPLEGRARLANRPDRRRQPRRPTGRPALHLGRPALAPARPPGRAPARPAGGSSAPLTDISPAGLTQVDALNGPALLLAREDVRPQPPARQGGPLASQGPVQYRPERRPRPRRHGGSTPTATA